MTEEMLFVYVLSPAGNWLGTVTRNGYDAWKAGHALDVIWGRGLHFTPDQRSGTIAVTIGPLYIGDTDQAEVSLFPTSVEIIGTIEADMDGNKSCSNNNKLFVQYEEAVTKWREAISNITVASPADLQNIQNMGKTINLYGKR